MLDEIIISIDAMGGDNAPEVVIKGIDYFLKHEGKNRNAKFLLHGNKDILSKLLKKSNLTSNCSVILHTEKFIEMDAKPSHALRRGKGSSMWNSIESVKDNVANVAVSAGNTGALMAMSKLQLRMKPGVTRPAIVATWPQKNDWCVVLDVGANIECDEIQLTEFAILGEAFYRALHKKDKPTVGLLNVGTEELKGNAVIKAAHERLSGGHINLNYKGYIEGTDISNGNIDVVVTDGFTGNIALKTAEGTAKLIGYFFNKALFGNLWSKITTFANSYSLLRLKRQIDPRRANGGVFLGLNGIIIKSHGGTDHIGYANAIGVALNLAESSFMSEIDTSLDLLHKNEAELSFK